MSEWLKEHAWKAISAKLTRQHGNTSSRLNSTTCRSEILLDVTRSTSVFVGGFEPTLHSFYTVQFLISALAIGDQLRSGRIHEPSQSPETAVRIPASQPAHPDILQRGPCATRGTPTRSDGDCAAPPQGDRVQARRLTRIWCSRTPATISLTNSTRLNCRCLVGGVPIERGCAFGAQSGNR
jgi:hypothetical protein